MVSGHAQQVDKASEGLQDRNGIICAGGYCRRACAYIRLRQKLHSSFGILPLHRLLAPVLCPNQKNQKPGPVPSDLLL